MQMHTFAHANELGTWPEPIYAQMCELSVRHGGLFNVIASEPMLGSPSRGGFYQTYAEPNGDGWIINGHKNWATGGKHLTHLVIKLTLNEKPAIMLVPNNSSGVTWQDTWNSALSLRASDSDDVYFENVKVPSGNLIQAEIPKDEPSNAWFPMVMTAVYLGAAIAARNGVIAYALERVPTALGKPIATLPKVQREIGEIDLAVMAARTVLLDACAGWTAKPDNRRAEYVRLIAAKTFACETAASVTQKALRVAGGQSLTHSLPLERYFRDSQAGFSHPPSGDTAYEVIGQQAINTYQSTQTT
jgi:alkylation response protein AidB-like acyl-CoA dehydrogenase